MLQIVPHLPLPKKSFDDFQFRKLKTAGNVNATSSQGDGGEGRGRGGVDTASSFHLSCIFIFPPCNIERRSSFLRLKFLTCCFLSQLTQSDSLALTTDN